MAKWDPAIFLQPAACGVPIFIRLSLTFCDSPVARLSLKYAYDRHQKHAKQFMGEVVVMEFRIHNSSDVHKGVYVGRRYPRFLCAARMPLSGRELDGECVVAWGHPPVHWQLGCYTSWCYAVALAHLAFGVKPPWDLQVFQRWVHGSRQTIRVSRFVQANDT